MTSEAFIVYRSAGGYWEPQEWLELRRFSDREEAEAFVHEAWLRGTHCRVFEAPGPEDEEEERTECRRCGEIEVCSGPGLCEACLNHLRNKIPEARL